MCLWCGVYAGITRNTLQMSDVNAPISTDKVSFYFAVNKQNGQIKLTTKRSYLNALYVIFQLFSLNTSSVLSNQCKVDIFRTR